MILYLLSYGEYYKFFVFIGTHTAYLVEYIWELFFWTPSSVGGPVYS